MTNQARALALYAEGKSIADVARALGISPYKAKRLQPVDAEAEPAEETTDDRWDCAIKVPLEKAAEIFNRATDAEKLVAFEGLGDQEKMDCVLRILQVRMDALLAPVPAVKEGD